MSGGLAVFDLDGTITRHDTLGAYLSGYLSRHPWRAVRLVPAMVAPLQFLIDRDRGALKGALVHAVLGGTSREQIERWSEQFVTQLIPAGLYPDAVAAIAKHRSQGDRLLLMSASTDLYVPRIGGALGFDEVICTRVRWRADGRVDGRLDGANCRGDEKHRQLSAVLARVLPSRIYAYGDSASDLAHMALAHEAYLINASAHKLPAAHAHVRAVRWG